MPDNKEDKKTGENDQQALDLSSLQGLTIGPAWSDPGYADKPNRSHFSDGDRSPRSRDRRSGPQRRDRRGRIGDGPGRSRPPFSKDGPRRERPQTGDGFRSGPRRGGDGNRGRDQRDRGSRPPFKPTVDVIFYPEDAPFLALTRAIRASCRTYELFEIANLILEKMDRFVVVVRPKGAAGEEKKTFFVAVPDGVPFDTEDEAVNHVFKNHLETFFKIETVDVEPPKGAFAFVNRCPMTGELLGPPNYHRYQQLLVEHHSTRLAHVPFDRFVEKLEAVREPEVIQEWIQKMTKETHYIYKQIVDGETRAFDNAESARHFLISHNKNQVVRSAYSARFHGKLVDSLPRGNIRHSIEMTLEMQRRFPLDTANHLRGRLRRMNFTVYKKGSKGISYICSVKRKFREHDQRFAESVQNLIEFIENNPEINVTRLPFDYLGFPEAKVEETPADAESPKDDENAAKKEPEAQPEFSADQELKLNKCMQDLRWLVTEGFVVEYADGKLFAAPPKPKAREKVRKPEQADSDTTAGEKPDKITKAEAAVEKAAELSAQVKEKKEPVEVVEATASKSDIALLEESASGNKTANEPAVEAKKEEKATQKETLPKESVEATAPVEEPVEEKEAMAGSPLKEETTDAEIPVETAPETTEVEEPASEPEIINKAEEVLAETEQPEIVAETVPAVKIETTAEAKPKAQETKEETPEVSEDAPELPAGEPVAKAQAESDTEKKALESDAEEKK